jgi:hypothetical protein
VIHGCEYDLTAPSATVGFTHTGTLNRAIVGVELAPAVTVSSGIYYASTATAGRVQYDYGSNQTSGPVVMAQDFRMPTFSSTLEYLNGVLSLVSGGTSQGDWRINVDRTVTIRNGASAATTSTEVLTANTWYHSEWKVDDPNNTQTLRIYIAGSTVPFLEISGTYTGVLTRVPHFGPAAAAAAGVLDMDNFQIANDWIVNGSGTVAASLNFNGFIEGSNLVTSGNWSIVGTTPVIRAASALDTAVLTGAGTLTGSGTAGTTENYTGAVDLSGSGTLTLAGQPSVSRTLARTGTGVSTYTGRSYTGDIVGSCHFEQNAPDLAFFFSDVGPGTPQPGDRAFLVWAHPSAVTPGSEPFKPTGFTYFGATSDNTAGASFWYRVLDGSESSIDMGLGTTYMQSAILVVMRGYSAFNSLIYTTDAGTDAIHTAPGSIMDLSNLGVLIGNCERSASGGSTSMTPPAGFTKLVDSYHKTTSGVYSGVAYEGSGNKIISARAGGASHVPGDMTNNAAQSDVITWTLLMVPSNQGSPGFTGDSGFSGSGTLSLAGIAKPTGAITPNGVGTLSLTGIATPAQTLPLAGSGTLAFSGAKPAVSGSTTLSGVGLLNLSAGTNYSGFINPSGSGTLSLTGKVGLVGTTAYSGTGALSLVGVPKAVVTLALSGAGTLSGVGTPKLIVVRTLAGDGTLGGTGIKIGGGSDFIGALALAGAGTANYAGKPAAKGALVLAGSGSLLLVALRKGTLDLTGSGVLSLTGMDLNLLRDVRIQVSAAYGYDLDVSGPEGAALLTHALRGYLLNVDGPVARAVEVGSAVGHRLRVEAFDEDPA